MQLRCRECSREAKLAAQRDRLKEKYNRKKPKDAQ
jgi:hypothetical protein